tara:strand:+ start:785 stop:1801 length:1017 start_codon:yes stop_codon:yes gene_type:complete
MRYTESKVFLNFASLVKLINLAKLFLSFLYSRIKNNAKIIGHPVALSIEPTTTCNLGCPECPSGLKQFSRKTGNLTVELNKKIIDQLFKKVAYINYYFQGEPYINSSFFEFVKYANSKKIFCSTSTNGHFLNDRNCQKTIESGLKRLIISIDGNDQKTYEMYRKKGNYDRVIKGTENIIKWKQKLNSQYPHIIFQFLVVKPNEHLVEDMKLLSKKLGVNEFRIKTAQFYDFKNGNSLMPENQKYSRYVKKKNGEYYLKNNFKNHCWRMWSSAVITVNGELVPCCFDKDAKHKIGNLKKQSFNDIWFGKHYNHFRNQILNKREEIDICKNCSEGSKIWA